LVRRPTSQAADARRGEVFDLTGLGRDHLSDALAASLALPLGADPHPVTLLPKVSGVVRRIACAIARAACFA
jgi:hypothetical protein